MDAPMTVRSPANADRRGENGTGMRARTTGPPGERPGLASGEMRLPPTGPGPSRRRLPGGGLHWARMPMYTGKGAPLFSRAGRDGAPCGEDMAGFRAAAPAGPAGDAPEAPETPGARSYCRNPPLPGEAPEMPGAAAGGGDCVIPGTASSTMRNSSSGLGWPGWLDDTGGMMAGFAGAPPAAPSTSPSSAQGECRSAPPAAP